MKKTILRNLAIALLVLPVFRAGVRAQVVVSARTAALIDGDTGQVIWERQGQTRALMASTTKIMTGFLVARDCPLDTLVTVPGQAVHVEGSSLHLQEGERCTVEELLYGMMLHSGNDAAVALAIHHSGSVEAFVAAMNHQAQAWELHNTSFANPHGLDDPENYTSAEDLAAMAAHAMKNQVFAQVVASRTASFGDRTYTNHNKLLWQIHGILGVKTGYTKASGRILVSCARRNGRTLIAVTMDDPNDWQDHEKLLDYGFQRYTPVLAADCENVLASVPVMSGDGNFAGVGLSRPLWCCVAPEEQWQVELRLTKLVYAPVVAGQIAGEAVVTVNGAPLASCPLVWRDTILEGAWDGRTAAKTDFPIWRCVPAAGRSDAAGGESSCEWQYGQPG